MGSKVGYGWARGGTGTGGTARITGGTAFHRSREAASGSTQSENLGGDTVETLLSRLIEKLARAEAFEDAADVALGTAIEIVRSAIQSSAFSKNARVLRAMIHYRPDDGYRRLVAVDVGADGALSTARVGDAAHVPSATAWQ